MAQPNLAAATAVSPITGTVVTVSVTAGAAATAGDTAFMIAGLDDYEVVTDVPVTDLPAAPRTAHRVSVLAGRR